MPSNIIHMALDSLIEGEPVDIVVKRVLMIEAQRRAKCLSLSNSGCYGYGTETSNSVSLLKKTHENKGGSGPITTNDGTSIGLDLDCNPDGKTVGEGVIRRLPATNTSYRAECELIYPPTTIKHEAYNPEGESTLVEYNLPINYFVAIQLIDIPGSLIKMRARLTKKGGAQPKNVNLKTALLLIFDRIKQKIPSITLHDLDMVYTNDITLVISVPDKRHARLTMQATKSLLKYITADGGKCIIDGFAVEESPIQQHHDRVWNETITL